MKIPQPYERNFTACMYNTTALLVGVYDLDKVEAM